MLENGSRKKGLYILTQTLFKKSILIKTSNKLYVLSRKHSNRVCCTNV